MAKLFKNLEINLKVSVPSVLTAQENCESADLQHVQKVKTEQTVVYKGQGLVLNLPDTMIAYVF